MYVMGNQEREFMMAFRKHITDWEISAVFIIRPG